MDELALVTPVGVVQETTRVIIDSIWGHFEREASNAVSQLRDEDQFDTLVSVEFSRYLHEIKAHSKHCPDYILKKLIDWRQQRMLSVNHKFDTDPNIENPIRYLYAMAVNIIYVRSVLMVVVSHTIAPDLAAILQNQAFECFCDTVALQRTTTMAKFASKLFNKPSQHTDYYNVCSATPMAQKRRLLFNLWCTLIGYLSQTHLECITGRLQDVMEEAEHTHSKARIIRGMRSIKLNVRDIASMMKGYALIRFILCVFHDCHSPEMKRAIGETLTLILYPLAEQTPTLANSVAVREWWKTVYDVYVMAENWSQKRKYHCLALPLMMTALCVMEKESFLSHRLMCCQKIYAFIKEHSNPSYRSIGLACVRRILEAYLRHFADGQTGTQTHLQNLNHQILFELRWDASHRTHQDGIVAYILTIAQRKPALALATIVASCLETGAKNRHCLAGLRSLNGILYGANADIDVSEKLLQVTPTASATDTLSMPSASSAVVSVTTMHAHSVHSAVRERERERERDEHDARSDLMQANDDTIETTYGPNLSNVMRSLLDKIRPVSNKILEAEIEGILCAAISLILRETKAVMLRHGSLKNSSIEIHAEDERSLEMFRLCILCLPRIHLWSSLVHERDEYDVLSTSDLIYLLAMSSISQHERIASSAQHVLVYLMTYHAELRCGILHDTSTYLLQQHGDNVSNISTLLTMLDEFIQIWLTQIHDTKCTRHALVELAAMDISKVEAACFFSLTSTSSAVRQSALNVIALCAELGKYQPKQHTNLSMAVLNTSNVTAQNNASHANHSMDESAHASRSQSVLTANTNNNNNNNNTTTNTATNSNSNANANLGSANHNNRWPDIRLQEIINAIENDIKQRYRHQYLVGAAAACEMKSVYELAKGECSEDQLEWTMCLGAILQKAVPKRCRCIKFAYDNGKMHVDQVLKCINNNEFDENMIGIWTNFVLFITLCVAIIDPIPAAAEELFQRLIPLLSMDRPDIQFMGALALGKIDPTMILTLMKCLESIQHSVFSLRKKPKHFIRLLQNLAYIYRFLAEDVDKSTILQSETIRERMISFVEKTMKFMEEFRANLRSDCLTIRIHFCIIVRNLLEKWPTISSSQNTKDGLDPIPARLRRRLFDFMISWSGQNQRKQNCMHYMHSHTAKSLMITRPLQSEKSNANLLQINQEKLEFSALAAIASLLRGQSFELDISSLRDGVVFKWIRTVVASDDPQVAMLGSLALQSYLSCNYDEPDDFIEECYNNNHIISKTFFIVLCQVWLSEHFNIPKPVLFHLAIYKMGDISMRVRSAALKMGKEIPCLIAPEQTIQPLHFVISSRLPDSYVLSQEELSVQLAAAYPSLSASIIREFGHRLQDADISYVGCMLNYIVPWLKNIDLSSGSSSSGAMANDMVFVMDILFRATVGYGTQYTQQVTNSWLGLTFKNDNIAAVLQYVLQRCEHDADYDKWVAIEASKRIALYCSRTCRKYTIQELIRIINKQFIEATDADMAPAMDSAASCYTNNVMEADAIVDLPEDPRTSLSTPAPPPYKRNSAYHKPHSSHHSNGEDDAVAAAAAMQMCVPSAFRSPMFNREQLELIKNVGYLPNDQTSEDPALLAEELQQYSASKTLALAHIRSAKKASKMAPGAMVVLRKSAWSHHNDDEEEEDDGELETSSLTKGDYALMLLVELAYEMDASDADFAENTALMLHVAILGIDHPFRSLGEHCKRLLMNLIHSIHFRDCKLSAAATDENVIDNSGCGDDKKRESAQELLMYLVSRRGKLMWQREMICAQKLFLSSSRYLQFLVHWLLDVITDKRCENAAVLWGNAAMQWVENCTSAFLACRSLQIYRSLQSTLKCRYSADVFGTLMRILGDSNRMSVWPEILITLKTWTTHIPNEEIKVWSQLIWNCINICKCEPNLRPHVYIHGLSLLAAIIQYLDLSNYSNGNIWDYVMHELDEHNKELSAAAPQQYPATNTGNKRHEFDGIQSLVMKGLLCDMTRKQSEEFLSGLTLMEDHPMISKKLARIHSTVVAQLPSICCYVQQSIHVGGVQQHLQSMVRSIGTLFFQLNMKEVAVVFDNIQTMTVDKLLARILKPVAEWISMTHSADITVVRLLLDLLDHCDTEYRRYVLCVLHGIVLWIDWERSALADVESNFFDRIIDLLSTNLWKEATMILEVVVKFNNHSSESPSVLFSPDPNIQPSPRKGLLSLDPDALESKCEFLDDDAYNTHSPRSSGKPMSSTIHCADSKGRFLPCKVYKDIPPFSPNNVAAKSLQQKRRHHNMQFKRVRSADGYISKHNHDSPAMHDTNHDTQSVRTQPHLPAPWHDDERTERTQNSANAPLRGHGQTMISAALASWQLVVAETKNETNCSPLPRNRDNCDAHSQTRNAGAGESDEQKIVSNLLHKSSAAFKSQKEELEKEKPSFSARRSLDRLLSFSGLKKEGKDRGDSLKLGSVSNSFFNGNTSMNEQIVFAANEELDVSDKENENTLKNEDKINSTMHQPGPVDDINSHETKFVNKETISQ
eukprot:CAMPEP_0202692022 /NCGR_PEP_ID=MMETSP1385-20130828/6529_1 /ASSEMBLY_ACC=CAM_ASM_000861 /TAXON_ID=933848 /ORGANISM="Elphidium margaritaceum" /LENGTH=2508 /DNA_ID=CAMNT_0049347493 /DNA_START=39 /DNA_END=7565 /DNA_ORIENTATION=+